MTKMYVLIEEHGEYEDFTQTVLGVFTSEEEARAAIPKLEALGVERWAQYQECDRREKQWLADNCTPRTMTHGGTPIYGNEDYAAVTAAMGPRPALVPKGEKYNVEAFDLNSTSYV